MIGQLQTFSEQLRSGLQECTWEARQEIVRALVKRIEIEEQTIRIVYKISPVPFEGAPPRGGGVLGNCGRSVAPALRSVTKAGASSRTPIDVFDRAVPQCRAKFEWGTRDVPSQRIFPGLWGQLHL